ncbi:MAG: hypothetical protein HY314_16570 [Acidobacteria bacterium]|nr:hypothetical protein [Acidobacteriota bacterium]
MFAGLRIQDEEASIRITVVRLRPYLFKATMVGLAVAYGIVQNHKGWINVYSEPGHGSVFKIYLPVIEKSVAIQEPLAETVVGGNETILVVDDEPVVLQLACDILRTYGYRTLTAQNGEEALGIYQESPMCFSHVTNNENGSCHIFKGADRGY